MSICRLHRVQEGSRLSIKSLPGSNKVDSQIGLGMCCGLAQSVLVPVAVPPTPSNSYRLSSTQCTLSSGECRVNRPMRI